MSERIINITSYSPLEIYGVNDRNINMIKSFFPKLKIVARGEMIKAIGSNDILDDFETKFELLLVSYDKFGKIVEKDIEQIMGNAEKSSSETVKLRENGVLVHGREGRHIKALTVNQQRLVKSCEKNDLIFAIGPTRLWPLLSEL